MNNLAENEIKYCPHCGSINKKSAVLCESCEEKLSMKYSPFYDFLKKHTKQKFSDVVKDSFFSVLKKYLLSHIYGMALSVTIVLTTVSAVYSVSPHIDKSSDITPIEIVSEEDVATENPSEETAENITNEAQTEESAQVKDEVEKVETEEITLPEPEIKKEPTVNERDINNFQFYAIEYDRFVDKKRSSEPNWEYRDVRYSSPAELYAETNIPEYDFPAVHEMISNPISIYSLEDDVRFDYLVPRCSFSARGVDKNSVRGGSDCVTSLAKSLYAAGYSVAECNYVLYEAVSNDETVFDNFVNMDSVSTSIKSAQNGNRVNPTHLELHERKLVYRFVYVKYSGKWYIAEDRLISRSDV